MIAKAVTVLLSLQFSYALYKTNAPDGQQHQHQHDSELGHCMDKISLFRNQRNAYLTGFALFLMLIIWKFEQLLRKYHNVVKTKKFVRWNFVCGG